MRTSQSKETKKKSVPKCRRCNNTKHVRKDKYRYDICPNCEEIKSNRLY